MANTDTALASTEEIRLALGKLYELQEDNPNQLEGLLRKHPEANPFNDWPLHKNETQAFLGLFEITTTPTLEQGAETVTQPPGPYVETITPLPNSVDAKKLEDMVNVFNNEIEAAKQGKARATDAAQKFVAALVKNAKRANVPMPETQAPVAQETEGTPLSPERVQEAASLAAQHPGPVEEKEIFFHALTVFSSEQPDKSVVELLPRAAAVTQAARVLSSSDGTFPREMSFSALATNDFQKTVAGALDRVVPAAAKEAIVNRILLQPLDIIANHPENISKNLMGEMVDRWGANFVNSAWFTKLRADANRMMGDQKGTAKIMSGLTSLISDVSTTVFRGPLDQNIITYIETYRLIATQGVPMVDFSHYRNITLGYGGQLVRLGANYAIRAGVKAGLKKAAVSALAEGGAAAAGAAAGTALAPGVGTLIGLAAGFVTDLLGGLFKKGVGLFKGLVGMGTSKNPEDNLLLVVAAGIVLVFFLPLFPLLNLPAFNQSMIDTSIASNIAGGGSADVNQYLDISITATPASIPGSLPATITYAACVKPKGSPSSFTINSAGITFSIYGGSGSPSLSAPAITPGVFSDGCYSFTIPVGTQFKDSVITATIAVNADVGEITGVDGSASVSTIVGNPPTGCFVFGDAGTGDAYGHVSAAWDNKSGILAAIGVLARSPQYMAQVCAGGTPITLYRVQADYGGGSAISPSSIFIYNACVTGCATYTLAHETGHIVDSRTGLFSQYNSLALYAREGPLWTYPNGFSEHEDFAETLGAYVVWHSYVWGARHGHDAGKLDYTGQYPLHYQFAKGVFGIEY